MRAGGAFRLLAAATTVAAIAAPAAPVAGSSHVPQPAPSDGARSDGEGTAPPERRVSSAAELDAVLRSEFTGRVIVPAGASWPMTDGDGRPLREIPLRSGVHLLGERGPLGRRPMLHTADLAQKHSLFVVTGNDVRVEGLHLRGPKPPTEHKKRDEYVDAIRVVEDAERQLGRRVVIADNELERWTGGAISAVGARSPRLPADWDPAWPRLEPRDAGLVRIERNYIHHNAMDGGGYGVVVGGGAYVTIEANVFDFNRHAVAASGEAYSGYVARFNYVLAGGYRQHANNRPDFYNQHFDVHGTGDGHYGGYAGEYFDIAANTIRGEQKHGILGARSTRPALTLRGRPGQGAWFRGNVVVHDDLDEAVSLKMSKLSTGIGEDHAEFNFRASGNRFDTDRSGELATGDFDGDGRTDLFVANGTGWFYSRAGVRPWEFLRASPMRTRDLGFADIDGDGATDVLWRDRGGRLGHHPRGSAPYSPLTSTPVPIGDLRFGDFDGDGATDIFLTRNGQWSVWYARSRTWTPTQTSSIPVGDLVFGEFDAVRGTDVVAATGGGWSWSSGSTAPWRRLNARLVSSLGSAVAADFDGNGRTDIAVAEGKRWRYSRDGRAPLATLRAGTAPRLERLHVGHFDGGRRPMVAGFVGGDRISVWRGLGHGPGFVALSAQAMR